MLQKFVVEEVSVISGLVKDSAVKIGRKKMGDKFGFGLSHAIK